MKNSKTAVILSSLFYDAEHQIKALSLYQSEEGMFICLIKTLTVCSKQMAGVLN